MIEFNPDGSLKLPGYMAKQNEERINKLKNQRCIKIQRELVNLTSPKKCRLSITLSEAITDNRFIENIYNEFNQNSTTPMKINKINDKQYEIEIGTEFKRCTECNSLINRYRDFLGGNVIDEKGKCTFQIRRNFCYEDYFS
jgi:hypothetical protein